MLLCTLNPHPVSGDETIHFQSWTPARDVTPAPWKTLLPPRGTDCIAPLVKAAHGTERSSNRAPEHAVTPRKARDGSTAPCAELRVSQPGTTAKHRDSSSEKNADKMPSAQGWPSSLIRAAELTSVQSCYLNLLNSSALWKVTCKLLPGYIPETHHKLLYLTWEMGKSIVAAKDGGYGRRKSSFPVISHHITTCSHLSQLTSQGTSTFS